MLRETRKRQNSTPRDLAKTRISGKRDNLVDETRNLCVQHTCCMYRFRVFCVFGRIHNKIK